MYLVVETSLPANKKLPHIPTATSPTNTHIPTTSPSTSATNTPMVGRRFPSRDQAEGWTGVFETEYME